VRRAPGTRPQHPDLFATAPDVGGVRKDRWAALLIDPAAQLAELADLVERGLVSPADLEHQRRKLFGA